MYQILQTKTSDVLRSDFFGTRSDPIQRLIFGSRSDPDPLFSSWNQIRSSSDPIQVYTEQIHLDPTILLQNIAYYKCTCNLAVYCSQKALKRLIWMTFCLIILEFLSIFFCFSLKNCDMIWIGLDLEKWPDLAIRSDPIQGCENWIQIRSRSGKIGSRSGSWIADRRSSTSPRKGPKMSMN